MNLPSDNGLTPTVLNKALAIPLRAEGPLVDRKESCNFCGSTKGYQVAKGDFWDLANSDFVRCDQCDLIQVDPMLTNDQMDKGCHAYYLEESQRESTRALNKKRLKSFRRGVYLGLKLKARGAKLNSVLEVGPGDGYFSVGLKRIYPNIEVHCLDIVEDVIEQLQSKHGFHGIVGSAEDLKNDNQFDLVIARDIIEHVANPSLVLNKFYKALKPQGYFHFITPNGYEDIWWGHCCWQLNQKPFEFLLNHVNYFPPQTLAGKLQSLGFSAVDYFIYDFNGTRWGRARKIAPKLAAPVATQKPADATIERYKNHNFQSESLMEPQDLWWTKSNVLLRTYVFLKEQWRINLNAKSSIGHEIFGLFRK